MHVYEVMAEPIRRRIVEILASGEHVVGDLEAIVILEFGVGRSAVQHHLRLLRDHDFVQVDDDWPNRWCRLDDGFVTLLTAEAKRLKRRWKRRIGWREPTDSMPLRQHPSTRGYRGHGADPDDPWRAVATRANQRATDKSGELRRRDRAGYDARKSPDIRPPGPIAIPPAATRQKPHRLPAATDAASRPAP